MFRNAVPLPVGVSPPKLRVLQNYDDVVGRVIPAWTGGVDATKENIAKRPQRERTGRLIKFKRKNLFLCLVDRPVCSF